MKLLNKILYPVLTAILLFSALPAFSFGASIKGSISAQSAVIYTDLEIKRFFNDYARFTNLKNIDKLMDVYDDSYMSADKFDKAKLKELATESWKSYPDVKYSMKVLSSDANYENATVVTEETMQGETSSKVDYIKGNGYIESKSVTVYYLKKFYGGWKIVSDYIIDEKTSLKYGVARNLAMNVDAPTLMAPSKEYSSILQLDVPKEYIALISLNNEPICFPAEKATEVFRTMKTSGMQERILKSNASSKNENAVASIGIAKADVKDKNIQVNIVGIAFLTSRVNLSLPETSGIQAK